MSDFKAKMHKNRFPLGLPRSSWNKGDILLMKGRGARRGRGRPERGAVRGGE